MEQTAEEIDDFLGEARRRADNYELDLRSFVEILCSKPHNPVQHRDKNMPWCEACGRTARGVLIKRKE